MKTLAADLLNDAVQRLVKEFQPEAICLFGSHDWVTPTENSDLDSFVIVPESEDMTRSWRRKLRRIGVLAPETYPSR
jgi:nucleotidyltransferase-like protein